MSNSVQTSQPLEPESTLMSLAAWYLHKVEQCASLADDAMDPCDRAGFVSERNEWLQVLAGEIGADVVALKATIALLPMDDEKSRWRKARLKFH